MYWDIKSARFQCLGHIMERMGEERAAERTYLEQPTGRRSVDRPRFLWKDKATKGAECAQMVRIGKIL